MNMKRARFWRNLLLFSALSGTTSLPKAQAQEGVSRVGPGISTLTSEAPGAAGLPAPEGFAPLTPSPYMPLDPGYNFQRPMPPALPPAYDTLKNSRRDSGPRFDIGQFLGNRMGVEDNDTNFNFLLPFLLGSGEDVLFVDGRGLVTDQGRGGASAGVGYRSFDANLNRIYGISGWVDYDQGTSRDYRQAGVSFESLGTWMDFRVNGYIPFGNESNLVSSSLIGDPFFSGSNLLINQRTLTESAYRGVDAEIGGPLPLLGRYGVSGYVGGYWMDSKTDETAAGPRVRIEANVTDNFRVNVTASDDKVFGTNAWVNMNFTLPDGRPRRWFRPKEVEDRLLGTVYRSYRVQTNTRIDVNPTPVLVAPPGTPNLAQGAAGTPVTAIFVDPDRLTNGDGTFERPFNTLQGFANTPNTTLVIVDGSAASRTVNGSITLFGDQKLLSTSILAAGGVQLNTNLGLITLPSLAGFGDATPVSPVFTSPNGGTLVTLAGANTEVAGFTFDGSTANAAIPNSTAISGSNLVDFNIHHNTFQNYRNAVVLNNATGVGLFQANTLIGTPGTSIDGFRLANSGTGLLDLFVNTSTPLAGSTLPAQGNNISGNDGAGVSITARNRAVINAHIEGNNISNNGNGVILDAAATRSVINASIANNIFDGNRGEDRNRNGILDPGEDLNGDGVLNSGNGVLLMANASTINAAQLGEDTNANGRLDLSEDTNSNGRLDPSEDLNGNGMLDVSEDTNGNGTLNAGEDTNGNGLLDVPTEDLNGNGILDAGEDLNGNGTIDVIVEDTNRNGVLDPSEDTNGNGILDPSEDTNRNGRLDGGFLITNNQFTRNTGDGLAIQSINNATINLIAIRNEFGLTSDQSTGNLRRGFSITADSGLVNANIGFISNEDVNFNGVLDAGEDLNGNGTLDAANPLDANNFVANRAGGMFVDLTGSAIGNIVTLNNNFTGQGGGSLTFSEDTNNNGVLDIGEDANGNGIIDRSFFIAGIGNGTAGLPFSFINGSPLGIGDINNLVWNLAPAGLEFNTAGIGSSIFAPANGTGATTGLISVNGATTGFTVTDQATALNLQFNNFQSLNGVLDAGEDANLNGVLDVGEDFPERFDFNIGTATAGGANTALTGNQFIGSTVTATFASGQVLSGTLQAVATDPTAAQFVVDANGNNIGSGPGVELRVSQTAVLNSPTFVGNNIQFHGGAGFSAQATEDGQINNLLLKNNTIQGNGSGANRGGITLSTVAATSAQINGSILDNTVQNNSGPGISVTADTGMIDVFQINNNRLTGNTNAISLNTLNSGTITTRITNNAMDGSTDDGFIANANSGTITLNQFTANSLTNAGGNGILFTATNGGTISIPATEDVNGNGTLDAGEDVNGNGFLDLGLRNNSLNNPVGNGLFVTGTNGIFNLGTVSGLSINRTTTGNGGIVLDVTDSVTTGRFIGNSLLGDPVNNPTGGTGFSLTATNGTFDVTIGGPNAADRNVIQSNSGAGIAILAQNTAAGTFRIENNLITGTVDDANVSTPFSGQGIYVGTRTFGALSPTTALFTNASIVNNTIGDANNSILSNVGGGILVDAGQESTIAGLTIDGNLISRNGPVAPGVFVANSNNVVNGLTFLRTTNANIDNVVISNNQITNNTFDGIYLHAFGGLLDRLDFTLLGNTINNNSFNGVNLRTEADAQLNTILTDNQITNNGFNGIQMTSFEVSATDQESQLGTWTKNTISGNAAHGIQVSTVSGVVATGTSAAIPLFIGLNGIDLADGRSLGNVITNNGMGGIEINAPGDLEINNNMISGNGASPTALGFTDIDGTGGIDVNLVAGLGGLSARVTNNIISANTGTGLEVVTTSQLAANLTLLGNLIDSNTSRGIDLLTRANGNTNAQIGDGTAAGANAVSNNGLEGIYIVNTASATQPQTGNVLLANGAVNVVPGISPITLVDIRGNSIAGNNNNGTFQSGGLSLLAGSSDSLGNGQFTGRVTNNMFSGNLGLDVLAQTFVATVNPPANTPQPAARLDLVFADNFGDALDVNQNNAVYILNGIPVETSVMRVEQGFNTTGFLNGQPGGAGEFGVPIPWTVVPVGTISNNINNFLFP